MTSLKSEIEKMSTNETYEYPLKRRGTVKTTACEVGRWRKRKYRVSTDWENEKVIVRRIE